MNQHESSFTRIARLNFKSLREQLDRCPSLVIPLGAMEPYGLISSTGILSMCCEAVASSYCSKHSAMVAPTIPYSCSKAFKAFEGSASINSRTLCNMIVEICSDWRFQGFKRFIIINPTDFNNEALELVKSRLNRNTEIVKVACLQKYLSEGMNALFPYKGKELGRTELGILSLASYLVPECIVNEHFEGNNFSIDEHMYKMWYKRGRDPQKLRKLFPVASTSDVALQYNPSMGKELSAYLLQQMEKEITPFLIDSKDAAS